ncbi:CBF-domain-containing protein [Polychaeton citri CBS 116435]|uniref:CBF-domain-containing protein n=1 Tax=Polychaeton citri CBS 116435 TaxID=1314669 RepID=A0A9P4QAE7_9PEZI|nr:CBF-domain-containing protein [Polychaeton citri CBS 116435]
MGPKRKAVGHQNNAQGRPEKKVKPSGGNAKKPKSTLVFTPRADWHAFELPALKNGEVTTIPPQHTVDALYKYAASLLEAENREYNESHLTGTSENKFMSEIMASGTLEDKISALTLRVQESPLHTTKAFANLINLSKKKSRNQALAALAALKDLLGQGVVLPSDRKLKAFGKQAGLLGTLQGQNAKWNQGDPLPAGLEKVHLLVWAFEDWLKKSYFELLKVLEGWCSDEVEYSRGRAITYVWELLKDKPEQEENLLRLLVNKLGDTDKKIASRASYLLLQLENTHPAMKTIITSSIEADCLFRPGQSSHAKYYAIITLNQTILSQREQEVANKLLSIYFSLFVQLLKPTEKRLQQQVADPNQGGGGKAGKMAAKKRKAEERSLDSDQQLHDKMIAQVLTGVNRAFPFADTSDPTFEKQLDTIFRITHSANFNTSVQALLLIQQISSTKHYGAERFYRTLYESLLDPRLLHSSKQVMYLNLLYKSIKVDLSVKRVQAFVKRLLQIITMHDPPFACGVLYLIHELESAFPNIRTMIKQPEVSEEDEEEHFYDAPEDSSQVTADSLQQPTRVASTHSLKYDPRKRDPEHAHAERSCIWELLPFMRHYHPSVQLFAETLLFAKPAPPKPDTTQHSLMHFLDRFVYRNAKAKPATTHGASIMQPLAGSNAADLLVKPGEGAGRAGVPVNSEAFWQKKVEDVAPEEVFFHSYFNQAGAKKKASDKKKREKNDDEDGSDEDEIWEALVNSRPDIEGPEDDDDDLSMGDLESAYSDSSDEQSEGGIDLGGDEGEDGVNIEEDDMDIPELDDEDEDALLGSDDDIPDLEVEQEVDEQDKEGKTARNKKKRSEKKKLKSLPTFASADDYAKMLDDEPDDL